MERQIKVNNWRIIKIDELLQTGRWYTAREIAQAVDGSYSSRTIQRDLEYMRDTMNAPIESGSQGYMYYEKNFFIKSIPLTEGEVFSVSVLNPLLEQYRNTPIENQLRSVFQKITNSLPEKVTIDSTFLNPKITFIPDIKEKINQELFNTVFDAMKNCRSLTFDYHPLQKSSY